MSTFAENLEFRHNLCSALPSAPFRKMIDGRYVDSKRQFFAICINTGELDGAGMIKAASALVGSFMDNVTIRPICINKQLMRWR